MSCFVDRNVLGSTIQRRVPKQLVVALACKCWSRHSTFLHPKYSQSHPALEIRTDSKSRLKPAWMAPFNLLPDQQLQAA